MDTLIENYSIPRSFLLLDFDVREPESDRIVGWGCLDVGVVLISIEGFVARFVAPDTESHREPDLHSSPPSHTTRVPPSLDAHRVRGGRVGVG